MRCPIMKTTLSVVGGMAGGLFLAFVGTVALGMVAGLVATLLNPSDPSAGSAAEIMIPLFPLTALAGTIAGAVVGWRFAGRRAGRCE